jgi:branched-chain amino acid transport system permease protein
MSDTDDQTAHREGSSRRALVQKLPVLLVPVLALAGLLAIGNPSTWLTLTVAGLAMGMMIFIMASGLTVVFGLMDVINFGHGAFVTVGAFVGFTVLAWLAGWTASPSVMLNLAAVLVAILAAMLITGGLGLCLRARDRRPSTASI